VPKEAANDHGKIQKNHQFRSVKTDYEIRGSQENCSRGQHRLSYDAFIAICQQVRLKLKMEKPK
jgi:hypothetical protein